ncbi:MAG: enoyl-CoA hydratase-related protein [Thermodesulfobacteriota bacterium]|jgi:enoyl-CoA hydratase/carnithine racemase
MGSWIRGGEGVVTILTLTRPPINALDREALDELAEAIEVVEADKQTRVLVIISGIEGIFCSGGDLNFWRQAAERVSGADRLLK